MRAASLAPKPHELSLRYRHATSPSASASPSSGFASGRCRQARTTFLVTLSRTAAFSIPLAALRSARARRGPPLRYPTSILDPLPSNAHVCSRYFLFKKFVDLLIFVSESVKSFEVCDRQQHRRFGDDDDEREKGGRGRAVPQQELHPALETREHPMPRRALA